MPPEQGSDIQPGLEMPVPGESTGMLQEYRTPSSELETAGYYTALRRRWEYFRYAGYPPIENPRDAEAFANSCRHSGDAYCAPETVDALFALAEKGFLTTRHGSEDDYSLGHNALQSVHTLLATIDAYRDILLQNGTPGAADMDDATVLAIMRSDRSIAGYEAIHTFRRAYSSLRTSGTRYLTSVLDAIPADMVFRGASPALHGHGHPKIIGRLSERSVREIAETAIQKNHEIDPDRGVEMGWEFSADLARTRAMILSLDINGATYTLPDQVTPNTELIAHLSDRITTLRAVYARVFPGQQLYVVPNTGMPAPYARGVIETAGPYHPDHVLAESGGVRLVRDGDATRSELTIPHAGTYRLIIDDIARRIESCIGDRSQAVTATKESMYSLMVRDPESGAVLLKTKDGEELSEWHITYLLEVWKHEIRASYQDDPNTSAAVAEVLDNLVASYNSAVGFVDIHDRRVHKFSALEQFMQQLGQIDEIDGVSIPMGLTPDQVTTVHIGDSSVDAPPPGKAPSMFVVALANRKPSMIERLAGHRRTIETRNEAIVGVIATVNGIIRSLQHIYQQRQTAASTSVN